MNRLIPDSEMFEWVTQAPQYPSKGPVGISYFKGDIDTCKPPCYAHCLLYRNHRGNLIGILNYYPMDIPPWEKRGNVNIFVHPKRRREGIATALLDEAMRRWPVNFGQQRYSESGKRFIDKFLQPGKRIVHG